MVSVDATGAKLVSSGSNTAINYNGITVGAALSNGALIFVIEFNSTVSGLTWLPEIRMRHFGATRARETHAGNFGAGWRAAR